MPYCRNCGAKLDEDARFCRVCGAPVTPIASRELQRSRPVQRAGFPIAAIAAIIIVLLVVSVLVVAFFPFQPVSFSQSNEASAVNVDRLNLIFNSDTANINVVLKDLPGNQLAATNVTATGFRGIFGEDRPLALSFDENTNYSTLTWLVNVARAGGWSAVSPLNVVCDLYIDPSVDLLVSITTDTGSIFLNADKEAAFERLALRATTGSVEASFTQTVNISGPVSLQTTTGSVEFSWNDAAVSANVPVTVKTTTGSTSVNITQNRQLGGNVTLNAQAVTGSVYLTMEIQNDVGAVISANTALGGVNVQEQGFSGDQSPLQSSNYPATNNFDVALQATTGGINIDAIYEVGGVRS